MNNIPVNIKSIQNRIYSIRGVQVMVDSDLAELYGVETKYLNRSVKRNMERFPEAFHFQLTENEYLRLQEQTAVSDNKSLRFQIGTSNNRGGRRYSPFVFTEQEAATLFSFV